MCGHSNVFFIVTHTVVIHSNVYHLYAWRCKIKKEPSETTTARWWSRCAVASLKHSEGNKVIIHGNGAREDARRRGSAFHRSEEIYIYAKIATYRCFAAAHTHTHPHIESFMRPADC